MSNELVGEDGNIIPEVKAQAEELVIKIANLCKEYPPAITLFVLEASLAEEIAMYAPEIADLFQAVMKEFKQKAAMFISVAALLKEKGINIEDLIKVDSEEAV